MEQNPYIPTSAALNEVSQEEPQEPFEPASRWRRLANLLLDSVGSIVVSMLIGILLVVVRLQTGVDIAELLGPALGLALVFAYYLVSEALFGRTLGKLVTGTRVIAESGGQPAFWQILVRSLYRFVPFEVVSFLSRSRPWLARPVVEDARGANSALDLGNAATAVPGGSLASLSDLP